MALYKSFDIEFSKEVLIMALLEEIIEFLVFSSYYIFSEVLYAEKKIGEDKRPPLKSIMKSKSHILKTSQ